MSENLPIPLDPELNELSTLTDKPVVDSYNSTSVALINGSIFTGTATNVSNYPAITVNVKSDRNGQLYIEFSSNASNWDISTLYTYTANTSFSKRVPVLAKWFRIRFINDSGANQTFLRIQSIAGTQEIETEGVTIDPTGLAVSSIIDDSNSSTIALNDSDFFTGSAVNISAYSSLTVNVITDQKSVLFIDFS